MNNLLRILLISITSAQKHEASINRMNFIQSVRLFACNNAPFLHEFMDCDEYKIKIVADGIMSKTEIMRQAKYVFCSDNTSSLVNHTSDFEFRCSRFNTTHTSSVTSDEITSDLSSSQSRTDENKTTIDFMQVSQQNESEATQKESSVSKNGTENSKLAA